jgi:hypothetical protein
MQFIEHFALLTTKIPPYFIANIFHPKVFRTFPTGKKMISFFTAPVVN